MDSQVPDEANDPLCGREVANGRYFVEHVLGKGGMGTVYAALQRPINRKVALKLIHRELTGNAEVVGRFMQEMRLTANIEHPHTVRLYDFGDIDGQPFLTTEFLQGRTLRVELANAGASSQARLCNVAMQIAKALRAAHEQGVVHRDLKPDNVMLLDSYGERDYVKVLDFGIARSLGAHTSDLHTRTGMLLGTPAYMSPEQCEGRAVDARSDLYSLGIVMYELATGVPPFSHSQTIPQLLMDHVGHAPPDLHTRVSGLAEPVVALIMGLLEKQPENRPPTAEVVVNILAPFATAATHPMIAVAKTEAWSAPPAVTPVVPPSPPAPNAGAVAHAQGTAILSDATPVQTGPSPVTSPVPSAGVHAGDAAVVPLPRRAQAAFFIVLGLVAILGVGAWLVLKRQPGVSPDAIAAALTLPGEPPFPAACVSARGRTEVLAAATGKAAWSTVPAGTLERAFAEARAPGVANEAARANLEKVVAACPNSAVARTLLGKTLVRLDQDQAAVTQLRAATALAPGYVNARFDLAVALVKQSEPAQALPLVTSVLVDQPEHPGARFLRGQLRLAAGDKQGAVDDLAAYTAAEPQAGSGWASLGEALAQVGDKARSRSAFCRALELGIERVRDRCPGR